MMSAQPSHQRGVIAIFLFFFQRCARELTSGYRYLTPCLEDVACLILSGGSGLAIFIQNPTKAKQSFKIIRHRGF